MDSCVRADSRDSRGFTLIEVLIVVAILGMATALTVPAITDAMHKARSAALAGDGKKLYNALMSYHADFGLFPDGDAFDNVSAAFFQ